MKLTDTLPPAVTWLLRAACWSLSLLITWWLFSFYASMKTVNHVALCMERQQKAAKAPRSSLDAAKDLVDCLDRQSGFPEKFMYRASKKAIDSLPSVPCQFVGVWTAARASTVYRVTLGDDSRYTAEPVLDNTPGAKTLSGSWGARDGRMIWLHDEGRIWPPDINQITVNSDTGFSLLEADRSTTRYELVKRVPSTTCTQGDSFALTR
jgi:hypothetical protein